jgi:hypothetical protein
MLGIECTYTARASSLPAGSVRYAREFDLADADEVELRREMPQCDAPPSRVADRLVLPDAVQVTGEGE